MQIHSASGDQRSLHDQQKDPAGKRSAVDVQERRQWTGLEHPGQIIAACDSEEDCDENVQPCWERKTYRGDEASV
jgi:hypothetical protein